MADPLAGTGPRILVVGAPRSGTTWIAEGLRDGAGCAYVQEPDNERRAPAAIRGKRDLGRFPVLGPEDEAPAYADLWRRAFLGGRPQPAARELFARAILHMTGPDTRDRAIDGHRRLPRTLRVAAQLSPRGASAFRGPVVIKSVHSAFSLDWIHARYRPRILVVVRNPLNVLASYRDLAMPDQDRRLDEVARISDVARHLGVPPSPPSSSPLDRSAWQLGLLMSGMLEGADRHGWPVVVHEEACVRPEEAFSDIASRAGLRWGAGGREYLRRSNVPGRGFSRHRVASEQLVRWRRSLDESEVARIRTILEAFPLVAPLTEPVR